MNTMGTRRVLAALLAGSGALALGTTAASCGGDAGHQGELMIVIQTDMSLPKDVDRARIEVLAYGEHKFDEEYVRLGSDESLKLPGTLGVLVGEDPKTPVTIRITAWQGSEARILREAVSTVPEARLAELRLPVQWLCDGSAVSAADGSGDVVSACGEGQTCIAGTCAPNEIDSSELPDYDEEEVFGGGTGEGDGSCFDTADCLRAAAPLTVLEGGGCAVTLPGDVNLAIQTEGAGICGAAGCFVPLDAESDLGWRRNDDGTATLPQAVCDKLLTGQVVAVVAATLSDECPLKGESLPTCGPWSNTGGAVDAPGTSEPVALATAQNHPTGLALEETTDVEGSGARLYWTNRGSFGEVDSTLEGTSKDGGTPTSILEGLAGARDLAVDEGILYFTAGGVGVDDGRVLAVVPGAPAIDLCVGDGGPAPLPVPEGIAVRGPNVFFTAFGDGGIYYARSDGSDFFKLQLDAPQNYPYRIGFDDSFVFWTNEGTATSDPPDGSVVMAARADLEGANPVTPTVLAAAEITPRALALDLDAGDTAAALYFTTFSASGEVKRVDLAGGPGEPVILASGQAYPNGLALDATHVYWTNRGDGTVMRLARAAAAGEAPTVIAAGQVAPGPIAVDATHIFWANEGSSSAANGSIMKIAKP